MTQPVTVVVNGRDTDLRSGATLADVVRALGRDPTRAGVAAARNGEVVPRRSWADITLDDGDRVEVLDAVGGG